ncbi:MAG: hypothetical protein ACYSOT_03940 [Planctomycetota bacterium]
MGQETDRTTPPVRGEIQRLQRISPKLPASPEAEETINRELTTDRSNVYGPLQTLAAYSATG